MAYTETIEERVEVAQPWDILQIRFTTITKKDGVEVGRQHRRTSIAPGNPLTSSEHQTAYGHTNNYSAKAEKIGQAIWTADSIKEYQDAHGG